jgi:hypothetical protein
MESWERLQERLFRLAELGEELAGVVAGLVTTWLHHEIEAEAATVTAIAGGYIDECERLDRHPRAGGDRA